MKQSETVIRNAAPADYPAIGALLDRALGTRPYEQRLKLWKWRFEDNPARTDAIPPFLVLVQGGRIAGAHGLIPMRIQAGGRQLCASCSCDFAVDPAARSAGMKLKLKAMGREVSEFHISTSANEHANRITMALGGKEVASGRRRYIKPLKVSGLVLRGWTKGGTFRKLTATAGLFPLKTIDWVLGAGRLARRRITVPDGRVKDVGMFDGRYDVFWEQNVRNRAVIVVRDSSYLNWRYSGYPFRGVQSFELSRGDELLGYSVVHIGIDEDGLRFAALLELAGKGRENRVLEHLLEEAERRAIRGGAHYIIARAATPQCDELLHRHGFRSRELDFSPITYKNNSGIIDDLFARDRNWYVTLGDGDGCYYFD